MGAQNAKQNQAYSSVQIDHPKFQNAKVYEERTNIFMQTAIGVQQKQFNKWKATVSNIKIESEHLLLPKKSDFATKGLCGSTGMLNVSYDYFPYLLIEEIQNRKRRKSKFQECELWFLLYSLSAAQTEMKRAFDSKIGDVRPQNIFINQEGEIKIACLYSWPKQGTNFEKTFEHEQTLLAPEDMKKLELGGMDDRSNFQSEMFSIGMTILGTALLADFTQLYDVTKFKFKFEEANSYLNQWRANTTYSEIFIAFVSNLCSFEPEKRLTQKQLWGWISKYEEEIKNKDDFVIELAPLKIQREIQELRGQYLSKFQHGPILTPINPVNIPIQERSMINPYVQRPVQNVYLPQNIPKNVMYGNNIQAVQSIYTPIPIQHFQKQFGSLPSGATSVKVPVVQRQFMPPVYQNVPPTSGNFVYTRRIIDPNSNSVVAEEQIGEEEYQRGITGTSQGIPASSKKVLE